MRCCIRLFFVSMTFLSMVLLPLFLLNFEIGPIYFAGCDEVDDETHGFRGLDLKDLENNVRVLVHLGVTVF